MTEVSELRGEVVVIFHNQRHMNVLWFMLTWHAWNHKAGMIVGFLFTQGMPIPKINMPEHTLRGKARACHLQPTPFSLNLDFLRCFILEQSRCFSPINGGTADGCQTTQKRFLSEFLYNTTIYWRVICLGFQDECLPPRGLGLSMEQTTERRGGHGDSRWLWLYFLVLTNSWLTDILPGCPLTFSNEPWSWRIF